jgi:hypothetical protein
MKKVLKTIYRCIAGFLYAFLLIGSYVCVDKNQLTLPEATTMMLIVGCVLFTPVALTLIFKSK